MESQGNFTFPFSMLIVFHGTIESGYPEMKLWVFQFSHGTACDILIRKFDVL